jgi:D-serine deaminase-like pyridoxal phosphate-dependent protein
MADISKIKKPTIILNEPRARRNIEFMAKKAEMAGITFRPHFKTHQSGVIAEWFREAGVRQITASSVSMCSYFMSRGWSDITIAFPANPAEIDDINSISEKIALNILISDYEQLATFAWKIRNSTGIYIKIDTGYKRSGIDWNQYGDLVRIAELADQSEALRMEGFLTHSGHTYNVEGADAVMKIFEDTRSKMLHTKEVFSVPGMRISIGDTPSCSIATDFRGIDEIRPGNFVFYDLMQNRIGSCTRDKISMVVACPVVSVNRHRDEIVIYGGAVHLSKDFILNSDGTRNFGEAVLLDNNGWDENTVVGYIKSVSQEHGILAITGEAGHRLKPGDIIGILPVHSCLATDLLRRFTTTDGTEITDFCCK